MVCSPLAAWFEAGVRVPQALEEAPVGNASAAYRQARSSTRTEAARGMATLQTDTSSKLKTDQRAEFSYTSAPPAVRMRVQGSRTHTRMHTRDGRR